MLEHERELPQMCEMSFEVAALTRRSPAARQCCGASLLVRSSSGTILGPASMLTHQGYLVIVLHCL